MQQRCQPRDQNLARPHGASPSMAAACPASCVAESALAAAFMRAMRSSKAACLRCSFSWWALPCGEGRGRSRAGPLLCSDPQPGRSQN